jgi:hypothetical protein
VIPKITKGSGGVAKLLWYLFGPGDVNEHVNPHVVAGFTDPALLQPPLKRGGGFDVRPLAAVLEAPVTAARMAGRKIPDEWTWHCSLSLRPEEGELTGERWQEIADAFMVEMDFDATAWVAARHGLSAGGNDHIHIVTTRFDRDGRRVSWHRDFVRAQEAARRLEHRFGLEELAVRDGATGRPETTQAEYAIARRKGRRPRKARLRKEVRTARSAAKSEIEFVRELRRQGLLVRARVGQDQVTVTGYSVALPDEDGDVIWYGGSKLDDELSLHQVRTRWSGSATAEEWSAAGAGEPEPDPAQPVSPTAETPAGSARVWSAAATRIAAAARDTTRLDAGPADTRAVAAAAVDMAARLADVVEPGEVGRASEAVDALARAAVPARGVVIGAPSPGARSVARALGSVAAVIAAAGRPADRDGLAAVLAVIAATAQLAAAVGRLQAANQRVSSARAAMVAYQRLGSVVQTAAGRGIVPPAPTPDRARGAAPAGRPRDYGRDQGKQGPQRGGPAGLAGHDGPDDRTGGGRGD